MNVNNKDLSMSRRQSCLHIAALAMGATLVPCAVHIEAEERSTGVSISGLDGCFVSEYQ